MIAYLIKQGLHKPNGLSIYVMHFKCVNEYTVLDIWL